MRIVLTKDERLKVLKAVDAGWYYDIEFFREVTARLPGRLYEIAHNVLSVLNDEPWRGFNDVLNEVLDY